MKESDLRLVGVKDYILKDILSFGKVYSLTTS